MKEIIRFLIGGWGGLPLIAVLALAGCQSGPQGSVQSPQNPSPADQVVLHRMLVVEHYQAGISNQGRPIEVIVLGQGETVSLILASIHGDETAGTGLIWRLLLYLQQHPRLLEGRQVVLIPLANPDGAVRKSRYNGHGVDLNRNFETANRINSSRHGFYGFSQPESRIIAHLMHQYQPDRVLSLHQPLYCIDYDGPALDIARHLARYCKLPLKKLGARPGSLGSYAGVGLGIPTITFEMGKQAEQTPTEILWHQYGHALLAFILYPHSQDEPLVREREWN
jgi:protein MpaA